MNPLAAADASHSVGRLFSGAPLARRRSERANRFCAVQLRKTTLAHSEVRRRIDPPLSLPARKQLFLKSPAIAQWACRRDALMKGPRHENPHFYNGGYHDGSVRMARIRCISAT